MISNKVPAPNLTPQGRRMPAPDGKETRDLVRLFGMGAIALGALSQTGCAGFERKLTTPGWPALDAKAAELAAKEADLNAREAKLAPPSPATDPGEFIAYAFDPARSNCRMTHENFVVRDEGRTSVNAGVNCGGNQMEYDLACANTNNGVLDTEGKTVGADCKSGWEATTDPGDGKTIHTPKFFVPVHDAANVSYAYGINGQPNLRVVGGYVEPLPSTQPKKK